MWNELEKDSVTIREACGNTVRNVTASDQAGIDPDEPFDVTPYAHALFAYFLRKPVCQEMGRKFKIAFSSSEKDTALIFMHDLGVIPRIREVNARPDDPNLNDSDGQSVGRGELKRGFKVMVGGGLGAQPHLAITTHEFLEEDLLIPYTEAVLRVFDRHGERNSRHKARIKFLIQKIGIDAFNELVAAEQKALTYQRYKVDVNGQWSPDSYREVNRNPEPQFAIHHSPLTIDPYKFALWKNTYVVPQKQEGFLAVYVSVPNGNIVSHTCCRFFDKFKYFIVYDVRITLNMSLESL